MPLLSVIKGPNVRPDPRLTTACIVLFVSSYILQIGFKANNENSVRQNEDLGGSSTKWGEIQFHYSPLPFWIIPLICFVDSFESSRIV